jgi:hypothetical protein
MTCMLATGILAIGILEGSGNQVSEDTDRMVHVGDIKMGYRIYGNGFPSWRIL